MDDTEQEFKKPVPLAKLSLDGAVIHEKGRCILNVPSSIYTEPSWSGVPPPDYSFEVIKQGTIIRNVNIKKSFIVIGRLTHCDIVIEHPSGSRYHSVVQYCKGIDNRSKGFYIYDLGSTHGTYLNKEHITPKVYYKLKIGHILKFGGSTRLFVFQGPDDQVCEEGRQSERQNIDDEICDWGLGEDAEDDNHTVNPFALCSVNEEMYLNDPKKALQNWFEREGYELEYDVEEKGFKSYVCRVELPINDLPNEDCAIVESAICGKKKEAISACALEACRTLDRCGLLCKAEKKSCHKQKNKEDDFYDSDDDLFLDRTGAIEKKMEQRKKRNNCVQAETYDSLTQKIDAISKEVREIEAKLNISKTSFSNDNDEKLDPLDSYMSMISNPANIQLDGITKSKLRHQLMSLNAELAKLRKMRCIARPPDMQQLVTTLEGNVAEKKHSFLKDTKQNGKPLEKETKGKEMFSPVKKQRKSQIGSSEESAVCLNKWESNSEVQCGSSVNDNSMSREFLVTRKKPKRSEKPWRTEDSHVAGTFSMWLPPVSQTGDGTTHLNKKFGY